MTADEFYEVVLNYECVYLLETFFVAGAVKRRCSIPSFTTYTEDRMLVAAGILNAEGYFL